MIYFWIVFAALMLLFVLPTLFMSAVIYTVLLVRTKPEKWDRSCSIPEDEEYLRMFDEGLAWDAVYGGCKRPVEITNDGFRRCGEYFDFGFERAVIIIAGRMESCLYSYYFAEPFRAAGYNILVIDNRAHGLSDGKISSLGYKEYRDILAWSRLLHDELGNRSVVLHGICIGGSTALFALTAPDCPDYIAGMCVEGMYKSFYESFRNHMVLDKHPVFPFALEVMLYIRLISGANAVTDGPYKRIGRLKKPILFLHSREDQFSSPALAQKLYDDCNAEKRLVWFDHGGHSRIRINNREAYDRAILDFFSDFC